MPSEPQKEIYRTPACPLHFGLGYQLECVDCMAMPTIMPDGTLRDSRKAIGSNPDELRRWAELERKRLDHAD